MVETCVFHWLASSERRDSTQPNPTCIGTRARTYYQRKCYCCCFVMLLLRVLLVLSGRQLLLLTEGVDCGILSRKGGVFPFLRGWVMVGVSVADVVGRGCYCWGSGNSIGWPALNGGAAPCRILRA